MEGCKRLIKNHRFRNTQKDKYKIELDNKFNSELNVRREWQQENKYPELDMDMVHILSAIQFYNREGYDRTRKQTKKLVDDIRAEKDKITRSFMNRSLPVFLKKNESEESGREACGYKIDDFSMGI